MSSNAKKFFGNPIYYLHRLFFVFFNILFFPFRKLIFRKISISSKISIFSSIRNHSYITIGANSIINQNVTLWPTDLKIGESCQLNPGTVVYGKVVISNHVLIGPNCTISGGNHNYFSTNIPISLQGFTETGITISEDVWIGSNCSIVDCVTIGKGVIIGANSVVTKSIPEYSIAYGNPAKIVSNRNQR